MDIYGYISLYERMKRRKAQMVKLKKAEQVYSDLEKRMKTTRTSEERARELNRQEDKRYLELKRHLDHDQQLYGRNAYREQKTIGNRLLEIDDRRHHLNRTRKRERKLDPIPESDSNRRQKRKEPTKIKKNHHLAFSYKDDEDPLGRWVRYPQVSSTHIGSTHICSTSSTTDNLTASFTSYRLLPNIRETKRDIDAQIGDIIETVALSNASQTGMCVDYEDVSTGGEDVSTASNDVSTGGNDEDIGGNDVGTGGNEEDAGSSDGIAEHSDVIAKKCKASDQQGDIIGKCDTAEQEDEGSVKDTTALKNS